MWYVLLLIFTFVAMVFTVAETKLGKVLKSIAFIVVLLSFLFYEYPPVGSLSPDILLVKGADGKFHETTFGKFCWEWSNDYIYIPKKLELTSSVHPITPNPKVRFLRYKLTIITVNPQKLLSKNILSYGLGSGVDALTHQYDRNTESYTALQKYYLNGDNIDQLVTKAANDFNNEHSKDLAVFYNPLDAAQDSALTALIEPYFNNIVSSYGLQVKLSGFSVE